VAFDSSAKVAAEVAREPRASPSDRRRRAEPRLLGEALAELVAELVAERLAIALPGPEVAAGPPELIDANEVARILGCARGWVYEHQAELGAIKLGNGARPRLRFARARVEAIAVGAVSETETDRAEPRRRPARRRHPNATAVKLLEIKGRAQ
jgi:hypothetical protein